METTAAGEAEDRKGIEASLANDGHSPVYPPCCDFRQDYCRSCLSPTKPLESVPEGMTCGIPYHQHSPTPSTTQQSTT